jgi:hypothetical protein
MKNSALYNLLLVLFLLQAFKVRSQEFDTIYFSMDKNYIEEIKELSHKRFLFVGWTIIANNYFGKMTLIDSLGNIKYDTIIYDTANVLFYDNILPTSNGIVIVGQKTKRNHLQICTDSIVVSIFNDSLVLQKRFSYFFSDTLIRSFSKSIIDHKGNIIISGYGLDNLVRRPYLWKIDSNYNIIAKNDTMFHSWLSTFEGVIDYERDSSYYVFGMGLSSDYSDMVMRFDYDLHFISMDTIKQDLSLPFNPLMYRKNEIIHVGKRWVTALNSTGYGIMILDSAFNKKWYIEFLALDTNKVPAVFQSISKYRNNVYIGAVINTDYYYSNDTTWVQLIKMDTNYNVLWRKQFLGYTNDLLTNVLATSDGGCLLAAWSHSADSPIINIHLIKLDSNGTTTWVRNIQPPRVAISLYPNPAGHTLNISLEAPNQDITACRIYDLHGRLLQQEHGHGRKLRINVQTLPAGAYIVEGETTGGKVFRAKFLKE